jgi:hypothetical protein
VAVRISLGFGLYFGKERDMSDGRFSKRDMERNEDPAKMGSAVGGAAGAGLGAGIGMAALGPLGSVIGALAGAVGGWWAGREAQQGFEEMDRVDNRLRRAHEHAGATRPYEEVCHGYRLGYLAGQNPDYAGAAFPEVEVDLRAAWVRAHLNDRRPVSWEDVRSDARTGFEVARQGG